MNIKLNIHSTSYSLKDKIQKIEENKEENLEDLKWSYPKSLFNKLLMVMIDKYIL